MGANTKLVGFLEGNKVQLERWGETAIVAMSRESTDALRAACYNKLPKKPAQKGEHLGDFRAEYDTQLGRVKIDVSVGTATYLADLMDVLVKGDISAMEKVHPWVVLLQQAVQAHKDYHNTSGEPGVPQ